MHAYKDMFVKLCVISHLVSLSGLNTDHKQIMLELESVLHEIHEYARQNPSKNVLTDGNACSSENKLSEDQSAQIVKKPFLKIDQISPNSIAEQAVSIYYCLNEC